MQEDEGRLEEPDKSAPVSHTGRKRNDTIHMKILVPSGAVGAIIGKGGESIAHVQWETGARIKLSKPNDFYPGTMERVCLIQGTLDGVTRMHNYIMDRMLEKPECAGATGGQTLPGSTSLACPVRPTTGGAIIPTTVGTPSTISTTGQADFGASGAWPTVGGSRLPWGRHQQVKILVPNCTAGLVIGKVGSYVKEIKDRTGAFIQISQKSKEFNLMERCITIAGEPDQCRAAVALVLAKIAEDPQSTSCPTISYSRIQGPVASAYPTGSPFALVSIPRVPLPGPTSAQAAATDVTQSASGYVPLPDTYMSPMIQAALMQAAALARSYYQSTGQQGFMTTSPPPPGQQSQGSQPGTVSTHGGNLSLSEGQTSATTAPSTDMSVYASFPQSGSTHLLPSGPTGLWTESGWGATSDSHHPQLLSGLTGATPSGASAATFEQAYPAPLNFAYFPAGQQLVTPIGSRHPSETFPSGTDIYPTSPYGTNLPMAFGGNQPALRVTSPTGTSPMAPIYPGLYSHLTPLGSADVASPVSKLAAMGATPSAVSLNELFNSMRLTGSNYPTSELPQAADLSQMFSALSQHPAGFVNVSGYPIFSSPTGPPSVLTSIAAFMDSSQHPAVQATPGAPPQLSLVSIEPSPGATFSAGSAGDLHSTVTSYAPRLLQTSDSATHMSHLFGAQSVPVIARRPMDPSEITPTTTSDKRPSVRVPAQRGAFKQPPSSHAQAICLSSPPCSQFEFPSPTSSSSAPIPTTKVQRSASPDLITSSTSQSQLESPGSPKDASSSQSGSPFDGSRQSAVAASDGRSTDTTVTTSSSGSETTAVTATQPLTSKSNTGKRILNGRPSRPKSSEVKK
ncbi:RNA-binding protein Nova-1 [Clonorchis sinensis]|uniref:RNA-binding protein Nova-1 n=1 Tax=Clonorchis sinensis TaxID=79923 RepID=A0A8T1LZQ2_CLOSI|nr:RNA-binding protein Nova-1 [Clonorchis sinensis]